MSAVEASILESYDPHHLFHDEHAVEQELPLCGSGGSAQTVLPQLRKVEGGDPPGQRRLDDVEEDLGRPLEDEGGSPSEASF